ncbi:hypothetical protein ABZ897_14960 [Nonomuraea sp. NPDC046802]|uniref:hypothetical protein n=1 Tax=Nonomuraea sp. NPDC046802 TaxID=3154919 RepID=UPI0033DD394C
MEYLPPRRKNDVARVVAGGCLSGVALFAMLLSFIPTNHDWDPSWPAYSDHESVALAIMASGFAIIVGLTAAVVFGKKVAWGIFVAFLAIEGYRFVELLAHYEW